MIDFDISYFRQEIVRFRELFGSKTFWAKTPEQRQVAINGLAFVYATIKASATEMADAANLLDNTLTEYNRREMMLYLSGKTQI